jgi:nucleotide-binding universal stress UspA family protein
MPEATQAQQRQPGRAGAARLVCAYEVAGPGGALHGAAFEAGRLVLAWDAYLLRITPDSGRVVDRLETFPAPGGLAYDGSALWQRSQGAEGFLQQLDPRTGFVVQSVAPQLEAITGLACLESDLLVLHGGGRRLTRLRVEPWGLEREAVIVSAVDVPVALRGLAWAGGELWSATEDALLRIDPATGGLLEQLALHADVAICDVAADVQGRFWCVDGRSCTLRVFARPRPTEADGSFRPRVQAPPSSRVTEAAGESPGGAGSAANDVSRAKARGSFERILVPVDFSAASRQALATALLLQDRLGSEVHLFHLTEQGPNAEFLAEAGARVSYVGLTGEACADLERMVDNVFPGRAKGVVYHSHVGHDLVGGVRDVARAIDATLVLLAGRPHRTLFRTRIERITRALEGNVMVVAEE